MYTLKLTMLDSNHEITRVIQVKPNITFYRLHEIIQITFGFEDCNYHFFHILKDNITYTDDPEKWNQDDAKFDNKDQIEEAIKQKNIADVVSLAKERYNNKRYIDDSDVIINNYIDSMTEIVYEYDELSGWQFKIEYLELNAKIDDTKLIGAIGPNPYEEGEGPKVFNTYLSLLEDPNQEVDEDMVDYIDYFGLEPKYPDINAINLELKKY